MGSSEAHAIESSPIAWPMKAVLAGASGECEQLAALNQQAQNVPATSMRRIHIV